MRRVLLFLALLALSALPASAQGGEHRAALVVRYPDGNVQTRCVAFAEPSISGQEVLVRSGLKAVINPTGSLGGAVCSIDGAGCSYPAQDCFCRCMGTQCEYWAYYHWIDGAWQYSQVGAVGSQVSDGAIEGGPGARQLLQWHRARNCLLPMSAARSQPAGKDQPVSRRHPLQYARWAPTAGSAGGRTPRRGGRAWRQSRMKEAVISIMEPIHPVAWLVSADAAVLPALLTRNPLYLCLACWRRGLPTVFDAPSVAAGRPRRRMGLFCAFRRAALADDHPLHHADRALWPAGPLRLPASWPVVGGPITGEALLFGLCSGLALVDAAAGLCHLQCGCGPGSPAAPDARLPVPGGRDRGHRGSFRAANGGDLADSARGAGGARAPACVGYAISCR